MVHLLVGKKGTGKTKRLIAQANEAIEKSKGHVAVVARGMGLRYDINRRARLIDANEYRIKGMEALYGLLSGICATNFDVTDIFVDTTLKIIGDDMDVLSLFVEKLNSLSSLAQVEITLSVSADEASLPEGVKAKIDFA